MLFRYRIFCAIAPKDPVRIAAVCEIVDIPVIASGGAGCIQDFVTLFRTLPGVDAGLAASIFHFGEVEIGDLKAALSDNGILVRR